MFLVLIIEGQRTSLVYEAVSVEGIEVFYPIKTELLRLLKAIIKSLEVGANRSSFAYSSESFSAADDKLKEGLTILNLKNHLNNGTLIVKLQS